MAKCNVRGCSEEGLVAYGKEEDGRFKRGLICVQHAMEASVNIGVRPHRIGLVGGFEADGTYYEGVRYGTHD